MPKEIAFRLFIKRKTNSLCKKGKTQCKFPSKNQCRKCKQMKRQ
jgi:hypothetical protein